MAHAIDEIARNVGALVRLRNRVSPNGTASPTVESRASGLASTAGPCLCAFPTLNVGVIGCFQEKLCRVLLGDQRAHKISLSWMAPSCTKHSSGASCCSGDVPLSISQPEATPLASWLLPRPLSNPPRRGIA